MISIVHCFSVLVASGNGQRCNDLKELLRENLYEVDSKTAKYKVAIWKFGRKSEPEAYKRISMDVAIAVQHLFKDVDDHFVSVDNPARKRAS